MSWYTRTMKREVFINVAVTDLEKSKAFFTALGFAFDPRFTDEKAACLIVSEGSAYAMLLSVPFFESFLRDDDECADSDEREALFAISAEDRIAVDELSAKALSAGGKDYRSEDHGWMYARAFKDIDGHVWEVFCMDPKGPPPETSHA